MKEILPAGVTENLSIIDLLGQLSSTLDVIKKQVLIEKFRSVFFLDLWDYCTIACNNQFGKRRDVNQITEDVYSDTILKVFEDLNKFRLPKDFKDEGEAKKLVGAWIAKIASNNILSQRGLLKKQQANTDSYKSFLKSENVEGSYGFRSVPKSYDPQKMLGVWQQLSDFAKDILLLCYDNQCFPYFDETTREYVKNTNHLPKPIKNELIQRYGTTDYNYRKVKQRAFEAMFSCIINPELLK